MKKRNLDLLALKPDVSLKKLDILGANNIFATLDNGAVTYKAGLLIYLFFIISLNLLLISSEYFRGKLDLPF